MRRNIGRRLFLAGLQATLPKTPSHFDSTVNSLSGPVSSSEPKERRKRKDSPSEQHER